MIYYSSYKSMSIFTLIIIFSLSLIAAPSGTPDNKSSGPTSVRTVPLFAIDSKLDSVFNIGYNKHIIVIRKSTLEEIQ